MKHIGLFRQRHLSLSLRRFCLAAGAAAMGETAEWPARAEPIRYPATELPRDASGTGGPEWVINNFTFADDAVGLEPLPDGTQALRIGKQPPHDQVGRYTISPKYYWDPHEPGSTFRVSLRFAAVYGRQYNSRAGFSAGGPGGGSGVSIANGKLAVSQLGSGGMEETELTAEARAALGDWDPEGLHTYTIEWKTAPPGNVPCTLFVDGKHVASYTGISRPANKNPYLEVTFEYGKGSALVAFAEWDQVLPGDAAGRRTVMVFQGLGFPRLRLLELPSVWPGPEMKYYYMRDFRWKRGVPRLASHPAPGALARADAFYLAGIPWDALGTRLMRAIEEQVRDGAVLVVLGGPEAYGRGGYAGTLLDDLLPVKSGSVWDVRQLGTPTTLSAVAAGDAWEELDWSARPTVEFVHETTMAGDARPYLSAGDQPVLVGRALGTGTVYAFTGAALGADTGGFWNWPDWPRLLALVGRGGLTSQTGPTNP